MTTGREFHRATLLPNGNALLAGGDDGVNVLPSTEIYYNTAAVSPLIITTTSVPNGFISQPYVQMLLEQGGLGTLTWSQASGALPPGVTLGTNGILSGTPTATGTFTLTVQVTDSSSPARTVTATFTINVSLPALVFTSNTMPTAGAARAYSQPLPITGGTQPYNAAVTSGTLPPGLALSSTGILRRNAIRRGKLHLHGDGYGLLDSQANGDAGPDYRGQHRVHYHDRASQWHRGNPVQRSHWHDRRNAAPVLFAGQHGFSAGSGNSAARGEFAQRRARGTPTLAVTTHSPNLFRIPQARPRSPRNTM